LAADVGAPQPDRAILAGADRLKPPVEEDAVDLQIAGGQGRARVVPHGRTGAPQHAEAGADQPDRAGLALSRDHRLIKNQHGSREPFGVQRRLGGVLKPAPRQDKARQLGVAGDHALAEQAVGQLQPEPGGKVLQVQPPVDPGAAQPQPVGVRIWGEPAAQDVAEHDRLDGPGVVPGAHSRLVDRLVAGEVERLPAGDVVDQSPLDVRHGFPAAVSASMPPR